MPYFYDVARAVARRGGGLMEHAPQGVTVKRVSCRFWPQHLKKWCLARPRAPDSTMTKILPMALVTTVQVVS
jgi:hypothetical protein